MLDHEGGNNLIQEGWQAADLHVHSSCSNDVLPAPEFHPEAIYQKAKKKEFRYIAITDHDTMKAYDIIGWERERLITGVEISFNDPIRVGHTLHINVYQLDKSQFNELKRIAQTDRNIETFIAYLQDQNLPYVYNHPFWFAAKDKPNYRAPEDIIELFPVVEYNMKRVRKKNMLALWLASKYNKGIMARDRYAHWKYRRRVYSFERGYVPRVFQQYRGRPFDDRSTRSHSQEFKQ